MWEYFNMQTMTEAEIDSLVDNYSQLIGADLQQVRYNESAMQLNFYSKSANFWMTFSFKPSVPYFFVSENKIRLIGNQKKPLNNFITKHFLNMRLKKIKRINELGRVLELNFSEDKYIQIHLITGRVNISAFSEGKVVHGFKPKSIPDQNKTDNVKFEKRPIRSDSFFEEIWNIKISDKKVKGEKDNSREIQKKSDAIKKMQISLEKQTENDWQEFGEWLKSQKNFEEVPHRFLELVNLDENISWNIENAFKQKKKLENKIVGTKSRILQLKDQIEKINQGQSTEKKTNKKTTSLLYEADLKGKTIDFAEGRLYIGKSGPDNLKLLRKAKPWYLWLHIKDYPGAYGIFEKLKNSLIPSDTSMQQAAIAVIKQSIAKNQTGRFELIYTECRYVRPIKGAKSGQVTYSHEKVLSVKV
jgi:predicted ribosome quality control (RQC) complex YloA/Tae2 family protein